MAFSLGHKYFKKHAEMDMVNIDEIEAAMVEAFQSFILKLNQETLSSVIHALLKWANKTEVINMHKQIILYKALGSILHSLGEFAVPSLKLYMENTITTLKFLVDKF